MYMTNPTIEVITQYLSSKPPKGLTPLEITDWYVDKIYNLVLLEKAVSEKVGYQKAAKDFIQSSTAKAFKAKQEMLADEMKNGSKLGVKD